MTAVPVLALRAVHRAGAGAPVLRVRCKSSIRPHNTLEAFEAKRRAGARTGFRLSAMSRVTH